MPLFVGMLATLPVIMPVVESAREIPIADEVDVLVVGGTAAGVSAATAAAADGAKVYLAGGFTYLGEDMAGTLELECASGGAATPLERRMLGFEQAYAPYGYDHGPGFKFKGGYQYNCNPHDKFADGSAPQSPWDSVFYTDKASVFCTLERLERIEAVEAVVIENDDPAADAAHSVDHRGALKPGLRGPLTGSVTLTFLDGPRSGETVALARTGETAPCRGIIIRDVECSLQHTSEFAVSVDAEFSRVRLDVLPAAGAACHLLSRIRFRRPATERCERTPTPLTVKRMLDRELVASGVRFITGSPVSDILSDSSGSLAGVVVANRNGRQAILAKSVVDATRYSALSHLGCPLASDSPGSVRFTRVIQAVEPPPGVPAVAFDLDRAPTHHPTETLRLFRCAVELPMADWSYASLVRAESRAREITWCPSTTDDADQLRLVDFPAFAGRPFLRSVPDAGPLGARIRAGESAGRAAAAEARIRPALSGVSVESAVSAAACAEDVREFLSGLRHTTAASHGGPCRRRRGRFPSLANTKSSWSAEARAALRQPLPPRAGVRGRCSSSTFTPLAASAQMAACLATTAAMWAGLSTNSTGPSRGLTQRGLTAGIGTPIRAARRGDASARRLESKSGTEPWRRARWSPGGRFAASLS